MNIVITNHAVLRYQERVAPVTVEQAKAAMSIPIIARAAEFGAPYVRLPTGQRIVIEGSCVVTVLPKDNPLWRLGCPKGRE